MFLCLFHNILAILVAVFMTVSKSKSNFRTIYLMYPAGLVFSSGLNVCEDSQLSWLKCSQMLLNKNGTSVFHNSSPSHHKEIWLYCCMTNINWDIEEDFIV